MASCLGHVDPCLPSFGFGQMVDDLGSRGVLEPVVIALDPVDHSAFRPWRVVRDQALRRRMGPALALLGARAGRDCLLARVAPFRLDATLLWPGSQPSLVCASRGNPPLDNGRSAE